ncbi:unnamed protein product [Amoebophrya sp. A25]|nr:unnamed protein product [Amoebophrya sp. A25]|eukprot:GSA25T00020539001.1
MDCGSRRVSRSSTRMKPSTGRSAHVSRTTMGREELVSLGTSCPSVMRAFARRGLVLVACYMCIEDSNTILHDFKQGHRFRRTDHDRRTSSAGLQQGHRKHVFQRGSSTTFCSSRDDDWRWRDLLRDKQSVSSRRPSLPVAAIPSSSSSLPPTTQTTTSGALLCHKAPSPARASSSTSLPALPAQQLPHEETFLRSEPRISTTLFAAAQTDVAVHPNGPDPATSNNTWPPLDVLYVAQQGFYVTTAPPIPEGIFDPCEGDRPPETYAEIMAAKEEEKREEERQSFYLFIALLVLIACVVLPLYVIPFLGATGFSAPYTFIYKALTINAIPEQRLRTPLTKNPDVMDLEYPWYSFTEDMQLFLHSWCCYATRVAHTYDAAEIMPFWEAYRKAVIFNCCAGAAFSEQRYQLRKLKGLNHDWYDLTMAQQRMAMVEGYMCACCYAYQEAKEVDEAARIHISCCCQVSDLEDKYAEFTVGPAIKAAAADTEGLPGAKKEGEGDGGKIAGAGGGKFDDPGGVPLTQLSLRQLEEATGGERGQAIPADQMSFASRVIQEMDTPAARARKKDLDTMSEATSVHPTAPVIGRQRTRETPLDEDIAAAGTTALAVEDHEEEAEYFPEATKRELTAEELAALEEKRRRRDLREKEKRALEGTLTEEDRMARQVRLKSLHARQKAAQTPEGAIVEMNSSKRRNQMERDRAAKEELRRIKERERMKAEGLIPESTTGVSSTDIDDATSVAQTEQQSPVGAARGTLYDIPEESDGRTDVFSLQTKQRTVKNSTYATSETTDDSEYSSTFIAKQEAKRKRKQQKMLKKSFIDNESDVSDASTHAKKLARVKLPSGVFTKKQFKRLDEDKIKKLFLEADEDQSGSITLEEFGLFLDRRFGVRPSISTLNMLMKQIDDNNDGEIDEEEFVAFFLLVLKYANNAKKLNDLRTKKLMMNVCSNGALLLAFGILTLFAYNSSRTCEEVCRDETFACPGESRGHCTYTCFLPKPMNTYVEYGLLDAMMFWMLSGAIASAIFVFFCLPSIWGLVVKCCGARKGDGDTTKIHYDDDFDPESWAPQRLRKQVKDMHKLAPTMVRNHRVEDYAAAEREQTLNQLAKGNQIYFQPLGLGNEGKKHHDPRVPDPLKIMEAEFENEEAFLQALSLNPLDPVAWVPPGLADDFCVQVLQKEEEDEEKSRKRRRKEKLKKLQKRANRDAMDALNKKNDVGHSALPLEDGDVGGGNPFGEAAKRSSGRRGKKAQSGKLKHVDTRELDRMGQSQKARVEGMLAGRVSGAVRNLDLRDDGKTDEDQEVDALFQDAEGRVMRQETLLPGGLEEGSDGEGSIEDETQARARMEGRGANSSQMALQHSQQLAIPMTEAEKERAAYYARPMYDQPESVQVNHDQWSNWEQEYRAHQRSAIRKRVNQLILAAGEDPEKYRAAVEVARQNGPGNACMAFDEDDIRRLDRKLREMRQAKDQADAERDEKVQAQIAQLEQAMITREPYQLEEALANLSSLCKGTREHARLLSIARAELPVIQKEAEKNRVAAGSHAMAPHWSKYVAPDFDEEKELDPMRFQVPDRNKDKAEENTLMPGERKDSPKKKTGAARFKIGKMKS